MPSVSARPAASSTSSMRDIGMMRVSMGFRPAGFSRNSDTSMSPKNVSTSVRGIGVAVSTSTSTASPFCVSASRWCTPKRCCSSTIARARSRKETTSWNKAWVPTSRSMSPSARRSRISLRSAPRSRPVRMATFISAAFASGAMVLRCWRARISVGAMKAACRPASITVAAASSATTVLPEPTSPCNSRSMRCGRARSLTISLSACCCEWVSV